MKKGKEKICRKHLEIENAVEIYSINWDRESFCVFEFELTLQITLVHLEKKKM